ncbi:hypothetical protein EIN_029540, partial [Entamoeba invadens IP1]
MCETAMQRSGGAGASSENLAQCPLTAVHPYRPSSSSTQLQCAPVNQIPVRIQQRSTRRDAEEGEGIIRNPLRKDRNGGSGIPRPASKQAPLSLSCCSTLFVPPHHCPFAA